MLSVNRKIRRKLYLFIFATIYALFFFKVGIMYQENNSKMRQDAGKKIVEESKITRREDLISDFHHEPHILLKSLLKGEVTTKTIHNDTSLTVGKTTSTSKSFNRVKTENSDVLVFK